MTEAKKIRAEASHSPGEAVLVDPSLTTDTKKIREKAGFSQAEAAVLADTSLQTWRIFELSPHALTAKKRADCTRALDVIRSKIEVQS